MTTKGRLAEQVLRAYNGGDVSSDRSITLEEVMLLVTQVTNKALKAEYLSMHLPLSERIPPRAAIATYEGVAIEPYGSVTSGVACTNIDGDGFYVFWEDDGGQYWDTGDGGFWAISIEGVDITITRSVTAGVISYAVAISNLTYPATLTPTDVSNFITNCASGAVIKLIGPDSTVPNTFIKSAMSSIVVGASTIDFDYTPENAVASDVIDAYALTTHNLLASITTSANYQPEIFSNIACCVDLDNSTTLRGKAKLPAQPMNLPNGMGVWKIYPSGQPDSPYIPIPTGLYSLGLNTTHNTLGKSLSQLNCYEVFSNEFAIFNQLTVDLPSTVDMQLVVVDPDEIGEYDPLPVPPEMEYDIIQECLRLLGSVPPEDQSVDLNSQSR